MIFFNELNGRYKLIKEQRSDLAKHFEYKCNV